MENYPDRISAQTLAAALALGGGSSPSPTPGKVYQFAGSVPFLGLPALSADKVGNVYDVTDEFTSTTDFTDGGGKHYSAGTNVAIANTGTDESPVLKYDCLMGDLSEILDDIDDLKNASDEYPIAKSVTGINPAITDSADGLIQDITVYGRSDVSKNKAPITLNYIKNNNAGTWSGNTVTINGIDYTINVDENDLVTSISFNGTASSTSLLQLCDIQSYNDTYIFNGVNNGSAETYRIDARDENAGVIATFTNGETNTNFQKAVRFAIRIQAGYVASNVILKPMLRLATETDPTYEPYFSGIHGIGEDGEVDVVTCGKNLFGFGVNAADKTEEYRENPSQRLIVVSSDTNNIEFRYNGGTWAAAYIELPIDGTKEYSISYDVNATQYNPNIAVDTAHSDANRLMLIINGGNGGTSAPTTLSFTISNIQIEVGSAATPYEPYVSTSATVTTGIPLYAVGDVKDELDEKRGVVVKRCGKVTYAGGEDEEWVVDSSSTAGTSGDMQFYIELDHYYAPTPVTQMPRAISNYEVTTGYNIYYAIKTDCVAFSAAGQYLCIRITGISTVADLKTYLASNPVTVVYELAEPYEIPLAASEIAQLRGLRTYTPTTNITVTDAPTSTVDYLLNTGNGQAVADVQTDLQGQISNIPAWLTDIPENHKNIYRGKYLGNSVSAAQLAAIADGSFDDLYVGDYWTIPVTIDNVEQSVNWRIADMDYFIGYRDTVDTTKRMTAHHLVIVPDTSLYLSQPGSRTNGYNGSGIRTSGLDKAKTAINDIFPDMVLSHKNYISTAIDATGTVTRCEEQTCTIELMNQVMVFGFNRFQNLANLQEDINYSLGGQFALFRLSPKWKSNNAEELIIPTSGATYLIQDPCYSNNREYWTAIWPTTYGAFNYSYNGGVRPYFLLGDASN